MEKKGSREKIGDALLKVALGCRVEEVTEEYADVDGALKLTKRRKTKKDIPPDLKAVQLLLGETEPSYSDLSDEELEAEKNRLLKLLKEAAQILAPAGFDIEILEKHHNQKVDAPSGTAIALADSINEAMGNTYHYKYDRSATREKRDAKEIGIQAIRGGTIVGEHDVIFAGQDEVITFNHTAYSKAIFAKGAVQAAKFLAGKPEGRYDMADVIG